jgi:hypothetical protein
MLHAHTQARPLAAGGSARCGVRQATPMHSCALCSRRALPTPPSSAAVGERGLVSRPACCWAGVGVPGRSVTRPRSTPALLCPSLARAAGSAPRTGESTGSQGVRVTQTPCRPHARPHRPHSKARAGRRHLSLTLGKARPAQRRQSSGPTAPPSTASPPRASGQPGAHLRPPLAGREQRLHGPASHGCVGCGPANALPLTGGRQAPRWARTPTLSRCPRIRRGAAPCLAPRRLQGGPGRRGAG